MLHVPQLVVLPIATGLVIPHSRNNPVGDVDVSIEDMTTMNTTG